MASGSLKVSNLILTSQGVAVSGRKRYNIGVRGQRPHRLNLMFPETWQFQDLADAAHIGTIEVPVAEGADAPYFDVLKTADCLVFGNPTNATFLQSGYLRLDEGESMDEALQELAEDLRVFYEDGPSYVSRIVVNERM